MARRTKKVDPSAPFPTSEWTESPRTWRDLSVVHYAWQVKWRLQDLWRAIKYIPKYLLKVLQYSVILWDDRDFDSTYLLKLMLFKLQRLRKHITKHNILRDTHKISKQILVVETLLTNLIQDDYVQELYEAHRQKWGEAVAYYKPVEDTTYDGMHEVRMTTRKVSTEGERLQERKELVTISRQAERAHRRDLKRLFQLIHRDLEKWWD